MSLQLGWKTKIIITFWAEEICQILVKKLVNLQKQTVQVHTGAFSTFVHIPFVWLGFGRSSPLHNPSIMNNILVLITLLLVVLHVWFMCEGILNICKAYLAFITTIKWPRRFMARFLDHNFRLSISYQLVFGTLKWSKEDLCLNLIKTMYRQNTYSSFSLSWSFLVWRPLTSCSLFLMDFSKWPIHLMAALFLS